MREMAFRFMAGIAEVIIVGLIVRFFPGQENPKDNAALAMVACGLGYFLCIAFLALVG